jgi:hypothetical protein
MPYPIQHCSGRASPRFHGLDALPLWLKMINGTYSAPTMCDARPAGASQPDYIRENRIGFLSRPSFAALMITLSASMLIIANRRITPANL